MFLNIQIYLIVLKTNDKQFTSTTKKSLHITFNCYHAMLCSLYAVALYMLVTPFVDLSTNRCSTKTDKYRIMETMLHHGNNIK